MKKWILILLLLTACCPRISFDNGSFCVEIADDNKERTVGLMYVDDLPDNKGMFFVFPQELPLSFWMKNTLIPLDLVFLDKDMVVVDVKHNFQPCTEEPCESYLSKVPAKYVLEINAGLAERLRIKEGSKAELSE
ncbi:DUF192 domain-containing protein [Candidatus Woesearchaeota archaeon]|nr:DUF192 domain-containing protein [Candidatus Woesearchaeota archaeon]